jgi:hypothetical protein
VCGTYISYGGEVHTGFWYGNLRKGDHLEEPGVNVKIILKWVFKNFEKAWIGFIGLRIWKVCELL